MKGIGIVRRGDPDTIYYIAPYASPFVTGRYCDLVGEPEVKDLRRGQDFRHPRYRREVFHRFYEFHLRYGTHPGCVYFVLPAVCDRLGLDPEERLWIAYLNGLTQNPVTTYLLFTRGGGLGGMKGRALERLFTSSYDRLAFDTDRRYQKKSTLDAVEDYRSRVAAAGSQERLWRNADEGGWEEVWKLVMSLRHFGRLSAWSYSEYLAVVGAVATRPPDLLLGDRDGSRSHRNGLARVLGRDDLDWHKTNPTQFSGRYETAVVEWLESEAVELLSEARQRAVGKPWRGDVSNLTLESALCTYKSWHRLRRRYPNCYADMLRDRIDAAEKEWGVEDVGLFWDIRSENLPATLRVESDPTDLGIHPDKQNQYLRTGIPPMMGLHWPCFAGPAREGER